MRSGGLAVAVVLAGLIASAPARAATFTVNTEKDLLDAEQTDGLCAAQNGKCSLRAATMAANGNGGFDEIIVPKGTYELTQPRSAAANSLEGELDLDEAVSIDGAGPKKTIIRQTVNDRVIRTGAVGAGIIPGAILTDLTVTGGNVTEGGNQLGGGIRVDTNYLLMGNVVVRDNRMDVGSANTFGAGIAVQNDATLVMQESKVANNVVKIRSETGSAVAGGIYIGGDSDAGVDPSSITDSEITGNRAVVKGGGSSIGGGLVVRETFSLVRSAVTGNRADEGGGLSLDQFEGSTTIDSVTFDRNKAGAGAGLNLGTDEPVSIVNSTFSGNRIVKANPRTTPGGAAIVARLGDLSLSHVTIANNIGGKRGSLRLDPVLPGAIVIEARGSIIDGPKKDCRGEEIGTAALSVFGDASCIASGVSTNVVADPRLKPLAATPGAFPANFYGGTHALKGSSPAVDFVTSGCPPPSQDQLGFLRPSGTCDAGAVEREP